MSRGKEKQKIIIGMRKGSDFLKKSGIISMTTEYRLGNCRFDISKNICYAFPSLTVLKVKKPLKPSVLLAFRAFVFRFET